MREPGQDNGMINLERKAAIQTMLRSGSAPVDPLKSLSHAELRKLRSEIDRLLPESTLDGLNLESELVEQYLLVKDLQSTALDDEEIPLNQRSQLAGQVASTLAQLVKMQVDLKRDERMKKIENALLEAIATLPEEAKDAFFLEYTRIAEIKGATV